jgi:hypothetical protein
VDVVGFDRLNPQLQEQVIRVDLDDRRDGGKPRTYDEGRPAGNDARNRSARPYDR